MNWYKIAKDFRDRNVINNKIKYLQTLKVTLEKLAKLIFQSMKNAKEANYRIISSAKITSYPLLHDILIEADELALDSPWKFASLCEQGIGKINKLIISLKREREEITYEGKKDKPKKGWV